MNTISPRAPMRRVVLLESSPDWRTLLEAYLRSLDHQVVAPDAPEDSEAPLTRLPVVMRRRSWDADGGPRWAGLPRVRSGVPVLLVDSLAEARELRGGPPAVLVELPLTRRKLARALDAAAGLAADARAPGALTAPSCRERGRHAGTCPPLPARSG